MSEYIPAGTTTIQRPRTWEELEYETRCSTRLSFEFGLRIKGRNVFYILYLTDVLYKTWGFSIMIGDKTILNWCRTSTKLRNTKTQKGET